MVNLQERFGLAPIVFAGAVSGILFGTALKIFGVTMQEGEYYLRVLGLPGALWVRSLMLIVMPLIFSNMVTVAHTLKSIPGSEVMGKRVFAYYITTTVMATLLGLCSFLVVVLPYVEVIEKSPDENAATSAESLRRLKEESLTLYDQIEATLFGLVPKNIVGAAAENNLVGVIAFGLVLGFVLEDRSPIVGLMEDLNTAMFKIVAVVITWTPLAVFSLVAPKVAQIDLGHAAAQLLLLLAGIAAGLVVQIMIVYPTIYFAATRKNPFQYVRGAFPAMLTALGTSSSAASLPVNLACAKKNGVSPIIAKFVMSLGCTVNMDGSAVGFPIRVLWLAYTQGLTMSLGQMMLTCFIAAVGSMGAAPIPAAGPGLLLIAMQSAGVPVTGALGLIIAIDWLPDRPETMTNVTGDAFAAGIMQHLLGDKIAEFPEMTKKRVQSFVSRRASLHSTMVASQREELLKAAELRKEQDINSEDGLPMAATSTGVSDAEDRAVELAPMAGPKDTLLEEPVT